MSSDYDRIMKLSLHILSREFRQDHYSLAKNTIAKWLQDPWEYLSRKGIRVRTWSQLAKCEAQPLDITSRPAQLKDPK